MIAVDSGNGPFDAIVVLYNSELTVSPSAHLAASTSAVSRLIICDNSTDPSILSSNEFAAPAFSAKTLYIPMGGNRGLSKAYNRGRAFTKSRYVVLLDDDSTPDTAFFDDALHCIASSSASVYVPLVYANGVLLSPCVRRLWTFRPAKDLSAWTEGYSAVNAGMILDQERCRISHDERLHVDFVDHKFVADVVAAGLDIQLMNEVKVQQDYSHISDSTRDARERLKIYSHDSRVFYTSIGGRFFRLARIAYRSTLILGRCLSANVTSILHPAAQRLTDGI